MKFYRGPRAHRDGKHFVKRRIVACKEIRELGWDFFSRTDWPVFVPKEFPM